MALMTAQQLPKVIFLALIKNTQERMLGGLLIDLPALLHQLKLSFKKKYLLGKQ